MNDTPNDLNDTEKTNILFKNYLGFPSTKDDTKFYFESTNVKYNNYIIGDDVLVETIPLNVDNMSNINETGLNTTYDISLSISNFYNNVYEVKEDSSGIILKFTKLKLTTIPNAETGFYCLDDNGNNVLQDAIQYNYNSYKDGGATVQPFLYTLYADNGTTRIEFSDGNWVFDIKFGVVTFYDPDKLGATFGNYKDNGIYLTFYKYVGKKGIANLDNGVDLTGWQDASLNNLDISGNVTLKGANSDITLSVKKWDSSLTSVTQSKLRVSGNDIFGVGGIDVISKWGISAEILMGSQGDNADGYCGIQRPSSTADLALLVGSGSNSQQPGKEVIRIKQNGNVGIGTSTPTETLDVSGNANITGNLDVTEHAGMADVSLNNLDVSVDLNVTGHTGMADVSLNNLDVSVDLNVTGHAGMADVSLNNLDVSNDLNVTGHTGMADVSLNNLDVSVDLNVTEHTGMTDVSLNNLDVSVDLNVTGHTGMTDVSLNNLDVSNDLNVTEHTGMTDVSLNNLDVSVDLNVTEHTGMTDVSLNNLDVSVDLNVTGHTGMTDVSLNNLDVSVDLNVTGHAGMADVSLNNLDVDGSANITGYVTIIHDGEDDTGQLLVKPLHKAPGMGQTGRITIQGYINESTANKCAQLLFENNDWDNPSLLHKLGMISGVVNDHPTNIGDLAFYNYNYDSNDVETESESMRITNDGKVGINISIPTYRLQVGGDTKLEGNLDVDGSANITGNLTVGDANNYTKIDANNNFVSFNGGSKYIKAHKRLSKSSNLESLWNSLYFSLDEQGSDADQNGSLNLKIDLYSSYVGASFIHLHKNHTPNGGPAEYSYTSTDPLFDVSAITMHDTGSKIYFDVELNNSSAKAYSGVNIEVYNTPNTIFYNVSNLIILGTNLEYTDFSTDITSGVISTFTHVPFRHKELVVGGGNGINEGGDTILKLNTERPWQFKQVGDDSGAALGLQSTYDDKYFNIIDMSGDNIIRFFANDGASSVKIPTTSALDVSGNTSLTDVSMNGNVDIIGNVNVFTNTGDCDFTITAKDGDCNLILVADVDNDNETHNPKILFKQDVIPNRKCFTAIGMNIHNTNPPSNQLMIANSVGIQGGIIFETAEDDGGYEEAVERMRISSDGNIGIGTTNPTETLDVNGNVKINPTWISRKKVTANTPNERMGSSISTSYDGSRIVVGAEGYGSTKKGAVYIYDYDGSSLTKTHSLSGESGDDNFGCSVAMSSNGSRIIVGAYGYDNGDNKGKVYIYDYDDSSWNSIGTITGMEDYDKFGSSVAMSSNGSRIIVGAWGFDGDGNDNNGEVYIYEYDDSSWNSIGTIMGEVTGDYFGRSVAMSSNGSRIIVGAWGYDIDGANNGKVYIYEYNDSSWNSIGTITGVNNDDNFGYSIAMSSSGSRIVVGAYGYESDNKKGKVYIYDYNGSSWNSIGTITGVNINDQVGYNVAIFSNGMRIAINVYQQGDSDGTVEVHEYINNVWTKIDTISEDKVESLAISPNGSYLLLGCPSNQNIKGTFSIYKPNNLNAEINSTNIITRNLTTENVNINGTLNVNNNALYVSKVTSNVGIGTSNPQAPLHIKMNGSVDFITNSSLANFNLQYAGYSIQNAVGQVFTLINQSGMCPLSLLINGNSSQTVYYSNVAPTFAESDISYVNVPIPHLIRGTGTNGTEVLSRNALRDALVIKIYNANSANISMTEYDYKNELKYLLDTNIGFIDSIKVTVRNCVDSEHNSINRSGQFALSKTTEGASYTTIPKISLAPVDQTLNFDPPITMTDLMTKDYVYWKPARTITTDGTNYQYLCLINTLNVDITINADALDVISTSSGFIMTHFNFTGKHHCTLYNNYNIPSNINYKLRGFIVKSKGNYLNNNNSAKTNIDESLPMVLFTEKKEDKSCFGVLSNHTTNQQINMWGLVTENGVMKNNNTYEINSIGEGGIWVSNQSGNFENGDYITSSSLIGVGMKQTDDLLHNYTVAKITMNCNFIETTEISLLLTDENDNVQYDNNNNIMMTNENTILNLKYVRVFADKYVIYNDEQETDIYIELPFDFTKDEEHNSMIDSTFKMAFVGCTYHCG